MHDAIQCLASRSLSEKELRVKLNHKGWLDQDITMVIEKLRLRGYLNDEALCRHLFTKYVSSNKHGLKYILAKLKTRGLNTSLIQEDIANYNYQEEYNRALSMVERKFAKQPEIAQHKIARFLITKGFTDSTVAKVISEITGQY